MTAKKSLPVRTRWGWLAAILPAVLAVIFGSPVWFPPALAAATDPAIVLSPASALPNQTISVTGSGFVNAGGVTVEAVTVGGATIDREKISAGATVAIDTSGAFLATLVVPVTAPSLLAGSHTVIVRDSEGRQASATLTVPEPTLTLSPASGRAGTTVTVTGANFPVASTRTGADSAPKVYFEYELATGSSTRVATAYPDSAGSITATFNIPRDATPGSTANVVTATVSGTAIQATAEHSLAAASLTVSPASGAPGTVVTLTGSNLKPYVPVAYLTMENLRLSLQENTHTGADGSFTGTFLVPLMEDGPYGISVTVGEEQYMVAFTITGAVLPELEPPETEPEPPPSVEVDRGLRSLEDNLVRVFYFDNATKRWKYYDPRPAFSRVNTLSRLVKGQAYWISVKTDQNPMIDGGIRTFHRGWNLIGW